MAYIYKVTGTHKRLGDDSATIKLIEATTVGNAIKKYVDIIGNQRGYDQINVTFIK